VLFSIPSPERWAGRLLKALIISVKVFFGALAWEGFALIALSIGQTADDAGYFLLTGAGERSRVLCSTRCYYARNMSTLRNKGVYSRTP